MTAPWRTVGLEVFLDLIGPKLRKVMLADDGGSYKPDSCIAASRIGLDFLAGLGIKAEALRVEAFYISHDLANRYRREGRMPSSVAEREQWVSETGGHSIAVGAPMDDGHPGLHVVLLVDGRFLWDLSIDQVSRPQLGLVVNRPVVLPVDAKAFKNGKQLTATTKEGMVAIYQRARRPDESWRQSNNWRKDGRDAPIRQAIVDGLLRYVNEAAVPAPAQR